MMDNDPLDDHFLNINRWFSTFMNISSRSCMHNHEWLLFAQLLPSAFLQVKEHLPQRKGDMSGLAFTHLTPPRPQRGKSRLGRVG